MTFRFWKSKWWGACGIGLLSFAAGSLLTAVFTRTVPVRADSNRLFELRVYHDLPGKVPVMEARFREKTSKILAKHNLNVVGYWVTADASASENSFIFLLAHVSQEEAKKNWEAMFSDPEFKEILKAEQSEKTLEKAEVTYMRPTDFSPMK
jgi:hypothetical protein